MKQNIIIPNRFPNILNNFDGGVIQNGLVAEYRFDQWAGQRLWDYSIYHNNGTLGSTAGADTNDPTWTGQGLSFGGDDYVDCGNFGATIKTMQIVFYTGSIINAASATSVLMQYSGTIAGIYFGGVVGAIANEIVTVMDNTGNNGFAWHDATESISVGWHLLEVSFENRKIYLDRTVKTMSTFGSAPASVFDNVWLGARSFGGGSAYFTGAQAFFLPYSSVLTDAQRTQNYYYLKGELAKRGISI